MGDKQQEFISQARLIQTIKDNIDGNSKRFAFLLGAGASVTSGIPAGGELAKHWFKELEHFDPKSYQDITKNKDFDENDLSPLYSKIYQQRFTHAEDGYHQIEKIMTKENVKPSLGYIVLADFLIKTSNNVLISTNFDRLPETALLTTFYQHAKVIYHENMLPVVTMEHNKPMIIKIHNDAFFQPLSKENDTSELSEEWKEILDQILNIYHLIVLGYGGNDREGLKKYLAGKKHNNKIYWCIKGNKQPPADINCYGVQIDGFDEFMFALYNELLPTKKVSTLDAIQERIKNNAEVSKANLNEQITKLTESATKTASTQAFLENFTAKTWWDYQLKVNSSENDDKKDRWYREGVNKFDDSPNLHLNYANFLSDNLKDHDKAAEYYRKAIEIDPDNAVICGSYANFLTDISEAYDMAQEYYLKSLEIAPNNVVTCINYANFLSYICQDHNEAERYYGKALKIDPDNAVVYGNYAAFLSNGRKSYNRSEEYYLKSLMLDPNNANTCGNYAGLLLAQGRKQEALPYLEKAEETSDKEDLKLELLFYRLAHFPDNHQQLKDQIKQLLEQNIRSIGWDFELNIKRAERDGCAFVGELRAIAKQITTSPSTL